MKSQYKIIFFGTPDFVNPVLNTLSDNFDVVLSVRQPIKFDEEMIEELRDLNADFFVVASFGQILPKEILSIPKIACINIHPSLLPKYRGPSPIQNAILNGDTTTGVTFIKMDEAVDHGPIIDQFEEKVKENDTFESLAKRLFGLAAEHLPTTINNYKDKELIPQDDSLATYTKLLSRDDGFIHLDKPEENIQQMIKAYYPWPGAWTKFKLSNKEVVIKFLSDKRVQVEGKKPMGYVDLINGYENGLQLLEILNLHP